MTCRWAKMPAERKNRYFADGARLRKQRKIAAQIDGPVPQATYAAVLASGPCVYCGGPAKHVDHVRPLSRGGAEHETNLVPACDPCNRTKAARLLSGWNPDRVEHGIQHSPVVAAEWLRLTEGIDL
jgi:5-methylcytosine-specific restriction endonuclease McrA